jgi:hypothetical protein
VSDQLLSQEDVTTYLLAVDWLMGLVGSPQVASLWEEPSALANYTVGGVAAHAVQGGLMRLEQLLKKPQPSGLRTVEVGEYFGPNRLSEPGHDDALFVRLRAGAEEFALQGQSEIVSTGLTSREALAVTLPQQPAHRAVPSVRVPEGQVPLADYLRTRVLEVVVHGDDLAASVVGWRPPDPPPDAVAVCLGVCVDLARFRVGDVATLRAFTRAERAIPGALRVL